MAIKAPIVARTACENSFVGDHVNNPDGYEHVKGGKYFSAGIFPYYVTPFEVEV